MALQHSLTLDNGISLPLAYAKISTGTFTNSELTVNVEWYRDADARTSGLPTVKTHSFSLPYAAEHSLTYCYTQLKALDLFSGAQDV